MIIWFLLAPFFDRLENPWREARMLPSIGNISLSENIYIRYRKISQNNIFIELNHVTLFFVVHLKENYSKRMKIRAWWNGINYCDKKIFLKETFCICISMDSITDIYFARDRSQIVLFVNCTISSVLST